MALVTMSENDRETAAVDQSAFLVCPPCDRVAPQDADSASEAAERHERRQHDGEDVVRAYAGKSVSTDEVNDLMDEARELCNEQQYQEFAQTVIRDSRFEVGENL